MVIVLLTLAGCSSGSGSGSEDSGGSSLACDHFRNVAGDLSDGLLTDAELRDKLKEIHDDASIATPEVQEAARAMLSAMTSGSIRDLRRAITDMDAACTASGN